MNQSNDTTKKLWQTLSLLLVAIVLVVILDSIPLGNHEPPITSDTAENGTDSLSDSITDTTVDATTSDGKTDVMTPQINTTTLTFLGECAPGSPLGTSAFGSFNALGAEQGLVYFFEKLSSVIGNDDLTVAANSSLFSSIPNAVQSPLCIAPVENADIYKIGSVELLANLSPQFGDQLADTQQVLTKAGIQTSENGTVHFYEENGVKIAILFTQIQRNTVLAAQIDQMKELMTKADYRIVYFYGGEKDSHTQEEYLITAAHAFADAGASLIIGTGNGVLRPIENYNGTTILYSLGTLLDGAQLIPENATALLQLQLTLDSDGILTDSITIFPTYVYAEIWQPTVMEEETDIDAVFRFLSGDYALPLPLSAADE